MDGRLRFFRGRRCMDDPEQSNDGGAPEWRQGKAGEGVREESGVLLAEK